MRCTEWGRGAGRTPHGVHPQFRFGAPLPFLLPTFTSLADRVVPIATSPSKCSLWFR